MYIFIIISFFIRLYVEVSIENILRKQEWCHVQLPKRDNLDSVKLQKRKIIKVKKTRVEM